MTSLVVGRVYEMRVPDAPPPCNVPMKVAVVSTSAEKVKFITAFKNGAVATLEVTVTPDGSLLTPTNKTVEISEVSE